MPPNTNWHAGRHAKEFDIQEVRYIFPIVNFKTWQVWFITKKYLKMLRRWHDRTFQGVWYLGVMSLLLKWSVFHVQCLSRCTHRVRVLYLVTRYEWLNPIDCDRPIFILSLYNIIIYPTNRKNVAIFLCKPEYNQWRPIHIHMIVPPKSKLYRPHHPPPATKSNMQTVNTWFILA